MTTAGILHTYLRRAAFTADLVEPAVASDTFGTGLIFVGLVDDPASVTDHVDAFVGEIMVEAASAASTVTVGVIYNAMVVEEAAAAHTLSTFGTFTYTVAVVESITAVGSPDAFLSVIYNVSVVETATAVDTPSATVAVPVIYDVAVLEVASAVSTQDGTAPGSAGMFGRTVLVAGLSPTFVSPGSPNPSATVYRLGSGTALTLVKSIEVLSPTVTEAAEATSGQNAEINDATPP